MTKKVLILFTELSSYILNCLTEAEKDNFEIHLIRYPINHEAPFEFIDEYPLKLYSRDDFKNVQTLRVFINKLDPNLILVSGWIDRGYLDALKDLSISSKKVLMLDTPWSSTIKQKIWKIIFKIKFLKLFDASWVPGYEQSEYAQHLGFDFNDIYDGIYSCDNKLFNKYYFENLESKTKVFPKKLLFIGRYIEIKGIKELWVNFVEIIEEFNLDWELWCVGTGDLWDKRMIHSSIKHFGFLQPEELKDVISQTGIYVLPSKYEPWGVSLHEMVSAGMPVLTSDNVGSCSSLVNNKRNGIVFSHSIKGDFKQKMYEIMQFSDKELSLMGEESVHLSKKFTIQDWVRTLNKIYD